MRLLATSRLRMSATIKHASIAVFALTALVPLFAPPAHGQDWGPARVAPKWVAGGPLWVTPNVVRGLRSDRLYSMIVVGSVKLGDDHYGTYYKGYYADAAYNWESRADDINYPTQAPLQLGAVACSLGVAFVEPNYKRDHIYHTGWFSPQSDSFTIQLSQRPSRDNAGQIRYSLVELPADADPGDFTFLPAEGTWRHNSRLIGRSWQGAGSNSNLGSIAANDTPQGASPLGNNGLFSSNTLQTIPSFDNYLNSLQQNTPVDLGTIPLAPNNLDPIPLDEPFGVCTDSHADVLPPSDYQPSEGGLFGGSALPPMFPPSAVGPADVDLAPGFSPTIPAQAPPRPSNQGSNPPPAGRGDAINLLDQIASPVTRNW